MSIKYYKIALCDQMTLEHYMQLPYNYCTPNPLQNFTGYDVVLGGKISVR